MCVLLLLSPYFTQQRHEPPHYNMTNRYNPFTDIHHYNSFHIVPNSTMHVPSHLLIILNSSILTGTLWLFYFELSPFYWSWWWSCCHYITLHYIHKLFLKIKSFRARNFPSPVSFELMTTKLTSGNKETIFLNIYRLPSTKIFTTFFDEFQNLLEFLFLYLLNLSSLATSTFNSY